MGKRREAEKSFEQWLKDILEEYGDSGAAERDEKVVSEGGIPEASPDTKERTMRLMKEAYREKKAPSVFLLSRRRMAFGTVAACFLVLIVAFSMYGLRERGNAAPWDNGFKVMLQDGYVVLQIRDENEPADYMMEGVPEDYEVALEEKGHRVYQKENRSFDCYWGEARSIGVHIPADIFDINELRDPASGLPMMTFRTENRCFVDKVINDRADVILSSADLTEQELLDIAYAITLKEK